MFKIIQDKMGKYGDTALPDVQEVFSTLTSSTTLTDLAKYTLTPEIFLLASAALANLTFLDGGCMEAMRAAGTARVLLRAAHDNPNISIFTKDQVSTP